jgi:hypothetical protein
LCRAQQLYVIQRTPSSVDIRNNAPTTPEFAAEFLSKPVRFNVKTTPRLFGEQPFVYFQM